jgi:hypothetical protein
MANSAQETSSTAAGPSVVNLGAPTYPAASSTVPREDDGASSGASADEHHGRRRSRHKHHRRIGRRNRRFLAHLMIDAIGLLIIVAVWYVVGR